MLRVTNFRKHCQFILFFFVFLSFFSFDRQRMGSLTALGRWSAHTVIIVWADSLLVVLGK